VFVWVAWVMVDYDVCWCGFSVYCHMYEWLQMGFGLMIEFIGLFDTVHDYPWQFTITHTHTHTPTHSAMSPVLSSLAVAGSQLAMADVPLPLGSWTIPGLSYQLLTPTAHNNQTSAVLWLTHKLSHSTTNSTQLTLTNCPAVNISAWTTQKTPFHYCCAIVAMETCLFTKLLLSHSCCMAASFTVIA
jgi:hypothetical protein